MLNSNRYISSFSTFYSLHHPSPLGVCVIFEVYFSFSWLRTMNLFCFCDGLFIILAEVVWGRWKIVHELLVPKEWISQILIKNFFGGLEDCRQFRQQYLRTLSVVRARRHCCYVFLYQLFSFFHSPKLR